MKPRWLVAVSFAAWALAGSPAVAQSIISAHAGMVHYVEGDVYLADQKVDPKFGSFPEMKEKAVLRTELGRAEVLLNPGVFLRLKERSTLRMITNRLIDTRVEVVSGGAVVEAGNVTKDTNVTVVLRDAVVTLRKTGLYRFDLAPARLRVFVGNAAVEFNGKTVEVGAGKTMAFEGESAGALAKFNKDETDDLDRWSRRRGQVVAMANVSAAKSLLDSGYSMYSGAWRWNPYFGMFTYIPGSGIYTSPYGYSFWSPGSVGRVYYHPIAPPGGYNGGGYNSSNGFGYATSSYSSSGYSGTAVSTGYSSSVSAVSNSGSASSAASGSSSIGHSNGGGGGGGGGRSH